MVAEKVKWHPQHALDLLAKPKQGIAADPEHERLYHQPETASAPPRPGIRQAAQIRRSVPQVERDLLTGFTHRGVERTLVARLDASARKRHVPRPGIGKPLCTVDQQGLDITAADPEHYRNGGHDALPIIRDDARIEPLQSGLEVTEAFFDRHRDG
jgi:hypothetical protein